MLPHPSLRDRLELVATVRHGSYRSSKRHPPRGQSLIKGTLDTYETIVELNVIAPFTWQDAQLMIRDQTRRTLMHRRLADLSKHESQYCGDLDVHCVGRAMSIDVAKSLRQSELKKKRRNANLLLIRITQQTTKTDMAGCECLALSPRH